MPDPKVNDLSWVGSSKDDVRKFPQDAKRRAGHELARLEQGLDPNRWKPMPDVGQGVAEIIIDTGDAFRIFYVAKFDAEVYVLHAFQKTTQKTEKRDIDLGKKRYREVLASIKARRVLARKGKQR